MSSAETEQEAIEVTATAVDRPKFPAVIFNIALAEVARLGEQFRGLRATDNKSYEVVKKARATMRSVGSAVGISESRSIPSTSSSRESVCRNNYFSASTRRPASYGPS